MSHQSPQIGWLAIALSFCISLSTLASQDHDKARPNTPQKRIIDFPSTKISVNPGATVYRQTDGFQTTFSVMERLHLPLYVGIESAFMRWTPLKRPDYTGMAEGQTTIPLLATAIYRFENDSGVHPYVGGAAGLAFSRGDIQSDTRVELLAYLRTGVDFEISQMVSIMLEPRIGILDKSFLFAPQVGLSISL